MNLKIELSFLLLLTMMWCVVFQSSFKLLIFSWCFFDVSQWRRKAVLLDTISECVQFAFVAKHDLVGCSIRMSVCASASASTERATGNWLSLLKTIETTDSIETRSESHLYCYWWMWQQNPRNRVNIVPVGPSRSNEAHHSLQTFQGLFLSQQYKCMHSRKRTWQTTNTYILKSWSPYMRAELIAVAHILPIITRVTKSFPRSPKLLKWTVIPPIWNLLHSFQSWYLILSKSFPGQQLCDNMEFNLVSSPYGLSCYDRVNNVYNTV